MDPKIVYPPTGTHVLVLMAMFARDEQYGSAVGKSCFCRDICYTVVKLCAFADGVSRMLRATTRSDVNDMFPLSIRSCRYVQYRKVRRILCLIARKVKCGGCRWNHLVFAKLHSINVFSAYLRRLHLINSSKSHLYKLGSDTFVQFSIYASCISDTFAPNTYQVRTHLGKELNFDKFKSMLNTQMFASCIRYFSSFFFQLYKLGFDTFV